MSSPAPLPPREGELVAGKYRVEKMLGAGGMGIVYAARHEQLDQPVAIKFIKSDAIADELGIQRFMREARAAAKLKSEHVARVLDVGTLDSGSPYMVMELLEGTDLAAFIVQNGPLRVADAADWVLQACEAIAEAHAAGIVHRDLKPENLFLASTVGGAQHIKVLDFGISKSVDSARVGGLTRTQSMLGSPLYMSPEQMRSSRDVDPRTDVWALGVVLFELIAGVVPFEADTMPALCLKVVSEPPRSLAELSPEVPLAMIQVIERCLEKDPQKRYANAAEVAVALEPLVSPGSRGLVDRARLAISRAGTPPERTKTFRFNSTTPSAATVASGGTPPRPPTPNGWGAGTPPSAPLAPLPPTRRSPWPLALAGTGVAIVGLAALLLGRSQRSHPDLPMAPAAMTASPAKGPAVEAVSLVAATASAPLPSRVAPSAIAPTAAPSPSAAPSTAPTPGPSPGHTVAATARPAPGRPAARPAGADDDIPTMR